MPAAQATASGPNGLSPLLVGYNSSWSNRLSRTRAVVTGAAGFIGSHLTDALLSAGAEVLGIDSFTPYYPSGIKHANLVGASVHRAFQLLEGDLNELDLERLLRPGDLVFHLAGQPGPRASWNHDFAEYLRNNVDATVRLLEAAHQRRVARVVLASSSSVYGKASMPLSEDRPLQPDSPYGLTKAAAEQLALLYGRKHGLVVIPLRLFTVYGPRQRPDMTLSRVIDALLERRGVRLDDDPDRACDWTYVGDVVGALLAAAVNAKAGSPVNVGGGSLISPRAAISILENLVGRKAEVEFRASGSEGARQELVDFTRMRALGVSPVVGIVDGLRRQLDSRLAPPASIVLAPAREDLVNSRPTGRRAVFVPALTL
jgi:nucleoside-diphosphate-sugar epimerase